MLTAAQKKKLAKAAVVFASDVVEGRVPDLDPHSYCGCAAHELGARAGLISPMMGIAERDDLGYCIASLQPDASEGPYSNLLSNATARTSDNKSCGALVFVLLDLACDLDPSALDEPRAAPSPNTRKER